MKVATSQHRLVLDGLTLSEHCAITHDDGFVLSVLGENMTLGNPVPVDVVLNSMMQDGSLVVKTRDDNREAGFRVMIEASDGMGLALGEKALDLALGKRTTLEWTPPDGWGPTTVFDVLTSSKDFEFDDHDELRLRRTFSVRLTCLPFGRSPNLETVTSNAAGAPSILDAADATTGWTVTARFISAPGVTSKTPTLDTSRKHEGTGSLVATGLAPVVSAGDYSVWSARFTKTVSAFTSRYVSVVVSFPFTNGIPEVTPGDSSWTLVSRQTIPGGSGGQWYRFLFDRGTTASTTSLDWTMDWVSPITLTQGVWMDATYVHAALAARQAVHEFEVLGSVRAPGSLSVAHETQALGDVMVWMGEDKGDGYRPDMERWRVETASDTRAASTDAVSGYFSTGTGKRYEAPACMFAPGSYVAVMRSSYPSTTVVNPILNAQLMTPDGVLYGDTTTLTSAVSVVGGVMAARTVGVIELPPTRITPGSDALIRFNLGGGAVPVSGGQFDELWLYRVDDEATLLRVDCGTGTPSAAGPYNRLWVDVPSVDNPRGGVWVGTQANRSDARHPGPSLRKAIPNLTPPRVQIHAVTPGAQGAVSVIDYYPHSHTHNSVGSDG